MDKDLESKSQWEETNVKEVKLIHKGTQWYIQFCSEEWSDKDALKIFSLATGRVVKQVTLCDSWKKKKQEQEKHTHIQWFGVGEMISIWDIIFNLLTGCLCDDYKSVPLIMWDCIMWELPGLEILV